MRAEWFWKASLFKWTSLAFTVATTAGLIGVGLQAPRSAVIDGACDRWMPIA